MSDRTGPDMDKVLASLRRLEARISEAVRAAEEVYPADQSKHPATTPYGVTLCEGPNPQGPLNLSA